MMTSYGVIIASSFLNGGLLGPPSWISGFVQNIKKPSKGGSGVIKMNKGTKSLDRSVDGKRKKILGWSNQALANFKSAVVTPQIQMSKLNINIGRVIVWGPAGSYASPNVACTMYFSDRICSGNRTRVESNSYEAGVRFVNHKYD